MVIAMLIIRKEQMESFRKYIIEQFVDRSVIHLQAIFPDKTKHIAETDLRAIIHRGLNKAEIYNVRIENDVLRFLEYILKYGEDFDTSGGTAWAGEILRMENVQSSIKMDRLDEYIVKISVENL